MQSAWRRCVENFGTTATPFDPVSSGFSKHALSARITGIGWPCMIHASVPSEKSAAPPNDFTFVLLV